MRTPIFTIFFASISALVTLTGCSSMRASDTQVDYLNARAKLSQASPAARPVGAPPSRAVLARAKSAPALPPEFEQQVTLNRGDITGIDDLARRLGRISGLPVRVSRDLEDFLAARKTTGRESARPTVINPTSSTLTFADEPAGVQFTYAGSKRGLFDAVAARLGGSWRFDHGVVVLYLTETRTFFIPALPASSTSKETSGGSDSASGPSGSAGAKSTLEVTSAQSIWSDIEKSIRVMLTPVGKVTTSPATGAVVVTDAPDSLDRVASFLEEQKRFLSRQVAMEVQVFNLTLSDEGSFGVDINLVTNYLARYGLSMQSSAGAAVAAPGSSALSLSVLDTATGSAVNWRGSSILLSALQQQGDISNMRTANLVSLNNHAVPLRVGRNVAYLAQSSVSSVAQVGTSTALTPGTISEGYTLSLLPTLLDDDRVMLQMTMNISQLRQLRSIVAGNTRVEAPETDEASTIQRAVIRSGETLLLAGFESDSKTSEQRTGLLSFGKSGGRGRTLLVVMVTPAISESR